MMALTLPKMLAYIRAANREELVDSKTLSKISTEARAWCILTADQHDADGENLFPVRVGRDVAEAHRGQAAEREVQGGDVARLHDKRKDKGVLLIGEPGSAPPAQFSRTRRCSGEITTFHSLPPPQPHLFFYSTLCARNIFIHLDRGSARVVGAVKLVSLVGQGVQPAYFGEQSGPLRGPYGIPATKGTAFPYCLIFSFSCPVNPWRRRVERRGGVKSRHKQAQVILPLTRCRPASAPTARRRP